MVGLKKHFIELIKVYQFDKRVESIVKSIRLKFLCGLNLKVI